VWVQPTSFAATSAGTCERSSGPGAARASRRLAIDPAPRRVAPHRGDDTFIIRVPGGDVETQKTLKFDAEKKTVEVADRALNQR
jgi:hypothetical protein